MPARSEASAAFGARTRWLFHRFRLRACVCCTAAPLTSSLSFLLSTAFPTQFRVVFSAPPCCRCMPFPPSCSSFCVFFRFLVFFL